jgi:pimeloyl-ACP methyl ester carboxylesterase
VDVLDGLGLERAAFAGISFGGGILLDLAAYAPERISGAVLIVPAGIASVSSPQLLLHLFAPWSLYRFIPSRNRLIRVLRPLMSEFEEPVLEFFDTIIRHVNWIQIPPGPFTIEDLKCFAAPTLLFLAKEDIFVPFDQAYIWSKEIIPNLTAIEILDGPHIPTRKLLTNINEKIQRFLAESR